MKVVSRIQNLKKYFGVNILVVTIYFDDKQRCKTYTKEFNNHKEYEKLVIEFSEKIEQDLGIKLIEKVA